MKWYRLASKIITFLVTTGERAGKTINDNHVGSIADVQGTDAIEALISASFANQAVDSMAEIQVAELV